MSNLPPVSHAPQDYFVPLLSERQRALIDRAMHLDKLANGYGQRNYRSALFAQIQAHPEQWRPA